MAQGEQDAVTAASEDMAPPQVVPSSIPPWALLLVAFAVAQATTMLAAMAVSAVGPVLDPFLRSLAEASVPRAGTLEIDRAAGLVLRGTLAVLDAILLVGATLLITPRLGLDR